MAFTLINSEQRLSAPIEYRIGTNTEAFTIGEIAKLSSGVLTSADVNSAGSQHYVVLADVTGATGVANVPVTRLRRDLTFRVMSTGQVAATTIGNYYTLHTDRKSITATTTNGIFEITKTDGAATSTVEGRFMNAKSL